MPRLVVIAGPNGSGKSTLTETLRQAGIDFGQYINPDEIAATLTGDVEARTLAAQAEADRLRSECIDQRRDFSFETVFSHPSKLDVLEAARRAGFSITVYFVGVAEPSINIERVANRVALGGHDVPRDRIIARYERTMRMLGDIAARADGTVVFDNSRTDAAAEIRAVAECRRTATGYETEIEIDAPEWVRARLVLPGSRQA